MLRLLTVSGKSTRTRKQTRSPSLKVTAGAVALAGST